MGAASFDIGIAKNGSGNLIYNNKLLYIISSLPIKKLIKRLSYFLNHKQASLSELLNSDFGNLVGNSNWLGKA